MGCAPFGWMISTACEMMGAEILQKGKKNKKKKKKMKKKRRRSGHECDVMAPATTPITSHHGVEPTIKSVIYRNHSPVQVVMHPQDPVFAPSVHDVTGRDPEPRATRVRFALPEGRDRNQRPEEKVVVGGASMFRYTPSPLPSSAGREQCGGGTGEYLHYPTPIREGIYRLATENNPLTTMFSEENPNACSIV